MSPCPAPRHDRAAAPAQPSRDAARRRPEPTADTLDRMSGRLDMLLRDVRVGARSARQFESLVAEAEDIAAGIRAAFRGPTGLIR